MRTTVDIPDAIYQQLKARAAREGTSVKALVVRGVLHALRADAPLDGRARAARLPIIRAKNPGSMKLGPEGVYEYIPFP